MSHGFSTINENLNNVDNAGKLWKEMLLLYVTWKKLKFIKKNKKQNKTRRSGTKICGQHS